MSRRRGVVKREILPDPKFCNIYVSKFINIIMLSGKKSIAENIVYKSFDYIKCKIQRDPLLVFLDAVNNCKPLVEVKSRRVGGSSYQVPIEVRLARRSALSMRWLKMAAIKRSEKSMFIRLGNELIDASKGTGNSIKKRDEIHRMADANKAFSHFRF